MGLEFCGTLCRLVERPAGLELYHSLSFSSFSAIVECCSYGAVKAVVCVMG